MRKHMRAVGIVALAALLAGGYAGYRIAFGHPFTINQLANRQALLFLIDSPELFTQVGLLDGTWLDRHSNRLTDVGVPQRDADYRKLERFMGEVRRFDRASLSTQDQITYDILLDFYGQRLALRRFEWLSSEGLYPIAPMWGTQTELPNFLQTSHVVGNAKTARNYLARLSAAGAKLDAVTAEMQRQAALRVVLPISLLERAEQGIRETTRPMPEQSPLVTTFDERMRKAGIDAQLARQLHGEAVVAVRERLYPAYARMISALEALRPRAALEGAGVGRLPDGAAYYAAALRQMTTSDYTPEQVHALGLQEVARISAQLDERLRAQGRSQGTIGERMKALRTDPQFLVPDTDAGRRELIERYRKILDEVNARMPTYFPTVPAEHLQVERVPVAAESETAGAYYQPGAMDGSRPGTFFANLRNTAETPTWTMKTLAYHEGIPGHHFEIATAMRLKGLPIIRQQSIYTAYSEGWALYAERLAAEIGMYRDDPWGDIGRLQAELHRAVRLVVDTGLHAQGWSREQAIGYMMDTLGWNEPETVSEVERYMGQPGQACAYKIGQLKILELREHAKAALGERFDLRAFHGVVLGSGGMPLTELERLVDEWIAQSQGKRS